MKKNLLSIGNAILDTCFAWFTPKWRKKGHDALCALTRYLNYFGHKIKEERVAPLRELQAELRTSLLDWDQKGVILATGKLETISDGIADFKRNPLAEVVESFFVIMVVFMGIRTYYTQPFRIPTGSMQPTLNGIIIHPVDEIPDLPTRMWHAVTLGSSYVDITADCKKSITKMKQDTSFIFFTRTVIYFSDGSKEVIPCAEGATMDYFKKLGKTEFEPGDVIMRARIDAGDMVFVNRMAYHFRKPERGETFVFDTRGIKTREDSVLQDQSNGTHYIKRLCGLPGDTLEIRDPQLLINGEEAQEPTIQRVIQGKAPYLTGGYHALEPHPGSIRPYFIQTGRAATLQNPADPNQREYAALGDNTNNSLDSRYWGPVHQFNILGPASFTLWPFSSHWGKID